MLAEQTAAVCPECGTRIEGGFSSNLGRCMICLLRVGLDDAEEPEDALLAAGADRLGNYKIERRDDGTPWELGRGAMGVTYRAIDTSLQRPVALKLIDSEWVKRGAEARERFMREARAAAALRHPNVAAVYQFGIREENGQCFCAMELVEGETLEMRVRRAGPLDAFTTIDIALQVSSALAAAEKQGLVHRDLKPANLMLTAVALDANGSSPGKAEEADTVVKVIDFGVAKALAEKPDEMHLTHGGFVGTPAFASPEQFTDTPVDVRSDIYSLGATLWYLLTGHMPCPGTSVAEIRASQQLQALPTEQLKAARVPTRLISLLQSMLAPEPASRPGVRALTSRLQECRARLLDRWKTARRLALAAAVIALASAVALPVFRRSHESAAPATNAVPANIPAKSIAVLPFDNLSADQSNAYFADGIQDQILTKLASVADLKVISRISTEKYRSKPKDLKNVSQELGVATVLQGTVQKDGDRVRVIVQLIDARADTLLWAKSYDGDLGDVFAVQSEISQAISNALRAKLSPSEAVVLAAAATTGPEAYDFFLKGEYEQRRGESVPTAEQFDRAAGFYRQALSLDPSFALAAARLTRSRLWRHWLVTPFSAAELAEVKTIVDGALALAPDLAESHMALGLFHYAGHRQFEQALTAFQRALELQPNNADARQYSGYVYRRQGQWERSLAEMAKAEELDPREAGIPANIAASYVNLRQWNDAKRAASRSLALDPHNQVGLRALFLSCVNGDGRTDAARRVIGPLPPGVRLTTNAVRGSVSNIIEDFTYLHVLERDFAGALQQAEKRNTDPNERVSRLLARVTIRILAGDAAGEKAESEEARALLETRLRDWPDDGYAMTQLSWVYLALGRNADALRVARQAAEWLPIEKDAFGGPAFAVGLAQIQARAGEAEDAVKTLRQLLSIPAGIAVSLNRLKIDPVWDPLRDNPEFQQLLAGKEEVGGLFGYGQLKPGDPRFERILASRAPKEAALATVAEKSIAVLPFENLSSDEANAYFANGIQDDILVNLSRIHDLKVISRTSVMQYKSGPPRNLRDIGKELGVAHVLEGSVQREGGKVRVHVQLIDARNDSHLWAQTYDRDLADVFAIQSEIAQAIAGQLQARLSPTEKAAIEQQPTSDLAAFDLYTRARSLRFTSNFSKAFEKNNLLQAVDLLNEAVRRDPAFFLAWCELSGTHDTLYSSGYDRTPARLSLGDAAVQTALRLRPDAGEAHLRLAHHLYETLLDYDGARAELAIAHRTLPNHPQTFQLAGNIDRHQGRWNESIRNLERAIELDPRNFNLLQNVAWTYHVLRRYREMVALLDRALALAPKDRAALVNRGLAELDWRADVRPLRNTVAAILAEDPAAAAAFANTSMLIALCERDLDAAVRALEALPGSSFGPGILQMNRACTEGLIARVRGDTSAAHAAFSTARVQQEELIRSQPDNAPAIAVLGLIDAGLNRKEDALREGRRAMELMPVAQDSTSGAMMIQNFATICAWVGEKELALQQLETATRTPGMLSYGQLKLLPEWDPLRGDPRFEAIVASLAPK